MDHAAFNAAMLAVSPEIFGDSPRVTAIVGVAFVEASLDALLQFHMVKDAVFANLLFGDHPRRWAFGIKADIGYGFSLYGPETHADLKTLAKIRNRFAHNLLACTPHPTVERLDFSTAKIVNWCNQLKTHLRIQSTATPEQRAEPRRKFTTTVQGLGVILAYSADPNENLRKAVSGMLL